VTLFDPRLTQLGVTIEHADYSAEHWRLIAAWLTVNGNWDDVPHWAKVYQLDTLGGDRHVFGRAYNKDGTIAPYAGFWLEWPDGDDMRTPEPDGWANLPISAGFDWAQTTGPYSWQKVGNSDKLVGLGLPYPPLPWETSSLPDNRAVGADGSVLLSYEQGTHWTAVYALGGVHVSFFGVWRCYDGDSPPPPPLSWRCRIARWLCPGGWE